MLAEAVAAAGHAGTTPERIGICFKALGRLGLAGSMVRVVGHNRHYAIYGHNEKVGCSVVGKR